HHPSRRRAGEGDDGMNETTDPAVTANGQPTLSERVKELRLAGRMDGGTAKAAGTSWLPWVLCFLLAVGWAGFGIKWYRGSTAKAPDAAGESAGPATKGSSQTAGPGALDTIALEVKGYLIPTQQISISPIDVAGRVVKLNIEEGLSFKKGDVLAEIDSTPYQAMNAEAKAQVAAAKYRLTELQRGSRPEEIDQAMAELDDAKAQLEQFRREWVRFEAQKTLAITTREYEQAEAGYLSAKKRVEAKQKAYDLVKLGPRQEKIDAGQAEYEATLARLKQAEWKLENCVIKSPVTGVILTKKAEIGSLINPVVGGVSTNLCDIADLRRLEVDLEVNERDISKVRLDQVCRIKPDAFPDRTYEGYVERMMPIANRAKSVVPVRIKVVPRDDEKQGQYLKPEMGVTVTFGNKTVTPEYKADVRRKLEDDSEKSIAPKK
ncbi:MAG TPA: efflux RND transporter periplasmic adaptor subunit, partial [Gemmataceae bacterium]|nr:efflux RND transporter periplasmic adaptor subunit [Gemmataceae bacterium]